MLIFIVALLASVMLHELGHFLTAKKFGMKVTQFFIGFGKTLWSTFRGETEYGIKALPFGGFVKITGMTSVEEVDVADEPRSFRNQPGWQRIIVLAAGSFMHFVLALVLLFIVAMGIGQAANSNQISSVASCVPASNKALNSANPCTAHEPKSPAEVAGLKPSDKIVSIAGKPVTTWNEVHKALAAQQTGVPVPMVVERNGRTVHLTATLASVPGRSAPYLGITPTLVYQRSGFVGSASYAGTQFADTLTGSASAIAKLPAAIPDLFSKNRSSTAGRPGEQRLRRWSGNRRRGRGLAAVAGQGQRRAAPDRVAEHLRRGVQPAAAATAGRRPPGGGDLRANQGMV